MRGLRTVISGTLALLLAAAAPASAQDSEPTSWPKLTRNLAYGDDFKQVLHVYAPAPRGGSVEEVPELWRSASPAHTIDADTPPFLVIHGTLDEMISIEVTRNLVAALAEAGVEHVYAEVPTDHFDVLDHEAFSELQASFLASQLSPTE